MTPARTRSNSRMGEGEILHGDLHANRKRAWRRRSIGENHFTRRQPLHGASQRLERTRYQAAFAGPQFELVTNAAAGERTLQRVRLWLQSNLQAALTPGAVEDHPL